MLFPDLPGDARCWVYVTDAPMDDDVQDAFLDRMNAFLDTWTTHGRSVDGRVAIRDDRFVMVAATVDEGGSVSGCGIDAAVQAMDEAAAELGVSFAPALHVVFRDDAGDVQTLPRPTFRERVDAGDVTLETPVFDPSVTTLDEVRNGAFERPAGESWHKRVFSF